MLFILIHEKRHVEVTGQSHTYIFSIRPDNLVSSGEIGFSAVQVWNYFFEGRKVDLWKVVKRVYQIE